LFPLSPKCFDLSSTPSPFSHSSSKFEFFPLYLCLQALLYLHYFVDWTWWTLQTHIYIVMCNIKNWIVHEQLIFLAHENDEIDKLLLGFKVQTLNIFHILFLASSITLVSWLRLKAYVGGCFMYFIIVFQHNGFVNSQV
jgi:hypothetical protein